MEHRIGSGSERLETSGKEEAEDEPPANEKVERRDLLETSGKEEEDEPAADEDTSAAEMESEEDVDEDDLSPRLKPQSEAEALTDTVLARLVNKLQGRGGDLSSPLCSLIALLPQEAAARELLKLSTLTQDPYKSELTLALQQAGAVVALLASAVRGSEDTQRVAKLALAAIAMNSGSAPTSGVKPVAPSPFGLTPNVTPLSTPLVTPEVTPLQASAEARHDCADPLATLLHAAAGDLSKRISRVGSVDWGRRPSSELSERSFGSVVEFEEALRDDSSDVSSEASCESKPTVMPPESHHSLRPRSPSSWPLAPKGWTAALRKAVTWVSRDAV